MNINKIYSDRGICIEDTEEWEYLEGLVHGMGIPLELQFVSVIMWNMNKETGSSWHNRPINNMYSKLHPNNRYRVVG